MVHADGQPSHHVLSAPLSLPVGGLLIMAELFTPDLQQAERFLQSLDASGSFTFQTFIDNKERAAANKKQGKDPLAKILHGTLQDNVDQLTKLQQQGAGVYVMVNKGDGIGRRNESVVAIRSYFVDLDGAPIDPVLDAEAPPHIVVESSPGKWHAYWTVQEGESLADFKSCQKALAAKFNGDSAVCDLARVMRVPGFWHLKADPFQTRLVIPNVDVTIP